ncbi:hypothetical protein OKW29_007345 [Paraburkholderia sp. CI3]
MAPAGFRPICQFYQQGQCCGARRLSVSSRKCCPCGASLSRLPGNQWQPPFAAFAESPYPAEARPHSANVLRGASKPAPPLPGLATRFTTLDRRAAAPPRRAR